MSYIHFKTVYNLNYDKITFDGSSLSVGELRKLIVEKTKLVKYKKVDFELELSNADTQKVYANDEELIFKNARILVKRVVKDSAAPLRAQEKAPKSPEPPVIQNLPKNVYDSLAPLNLPSQPLVYVEQKKESQLEEQAKLESILKNSMSKTLSETSIQTCRFLGMKPIQKAANSTRLVPSGYICMLCRKPGHLKQFCPEAANFPKPEERPKYPSGIPRTNLRPAQPGEKFAMLGPEGYVVPEKEKEASKIIKKEKLIFSDDEEESNKQEKEAEKSIPKELKCPFGDHILKDAVLVPCCGHFICCDDCIRNRISNEQLIECPNDSCDQEIDTFGGITPYHEMRRKCAEFIKSKNFSNENNIKKEKKEEKILEKPQVVEIQSEINSRPTRPIQHSVSESIIRNNVYNNQYFYQPEVYYDHFGSHSGYNQNYNQFTNFYNFNAYQQSSYGFDKYAEKGSQNENLDRTLDIMTEKEFNEYKEKLLNDVNNRWEMEKREAGDFRKNRNRKSRSRSRSRKHKKKNKSRSRSRDRKKSRSYSRSTSRTRSKKAKKKTSRKKSRPRSRTVSRSVSPTRRKDENMIKNYRSNGGREKRSISRGTRKVLKSLSRSPSKYHSEKPRYKY